MDGLFFDRLDSDVKEAGQGTVSIKLLAKCNEAEIMCQTILKDATVWLEPDKDPETLEFFFVHSGLIELLLPSGPKKLGEGEFFWMKDCSEKTILKAYSDTKLIYVANRPMFDSNIRFEKKYDELLRQINEKDNYTYKHSRNVMRYAVRLYEAMRDDCAGISLDHFIIAALFHDVGKCKIPDEILKKDSQLTKEEFDKMKGHPIFSGNLLKPYYGEAVAEIARNHHERLDGSGYPLGIKGDEISFSARILAVADAFDAMTSIRGYNNKKDPITAVEELLSLPEKYDFKVCTVLYDLVKSGEISTSESI